MLYLGGDVGQDTFHALHPYELKNAREVRLAKKMARSLMR